MTSDLRRARRAFLLIAVMGPLVLSAVGVAIVLNLIPEVPDPAATHWGLSGADGFASPLTYLWMQLGLGFGVPVVLSVAVLLAARDSWGPTGRFLGAVALWFSGFFTVASVGSLWIQRGLTDASQTPDVLPVLGIALAVALALGALAWFIQPSLRVLPSLADGEGTVRPISLRPGDRLGWVGTATVARAGMGVLGLLLAVLVALTVALAIAGQGAWVITAAVTVLVALAMASTLTFRVRIGREGVVIRSLMGWRGVALPLSRITDASAVYISPLAEFGGWGWRIALDGRRGAVLRTGEALQVTTDDGRIYVATVDGSGDAVAVLAALLGRDKRPGLREGGE